MEKQQEAESITSKLLDACKAGDRESRGELYKRYYNYALSICLRYSRDREEAKEIVNDAFVKVFAKLSKCQNERLFRGWLRRVMINTAIDYYRRNQKHYSNLDIEHAETVSVDPDGIARLSQQEIMQAVQQLPPSYRYVFNLYVVEGYKHEEIARKMKIGVGTSKSNLARARKKLKVLLQEFYTENDRSNE